jgi:hypothetical protein
MFVQLAPLLLHFPNSLARLNMLAKGLGLVFFWQGDLIKSLLLLQLSFLGTSGMCTIHKQYGYSEEQDRWVVAPHEQTPRNHQKLCISLRAQKYRVFYPPPKFLSESREDVCRQPWRYSLSTRRFEVDTSILRSSLFGLMLGCALPDMLAIFVFGWTCSW